ncbi:LysR family transcriptional regulator [Roseicella frigidaeris]|uniref:LysR family transcriptional regulator n=1 Tax=Roseicella frigidaeris TaxID=2230885 RepID=A0A327MC75_9PROT|nr:LysR family transcriptional regulator [Roseicella frigidaeris]RAI57788.1 LysR family transcriptional regulator [Roseicella frigidaeris]
MIEKLEMLLALASERHFGRAAEVVGVTQQSLSAGIKQLEERLGVLLVQRGSRFQGFTAEGEKALEWARRIVGDARAMRQEVRRLSRGLAGHLRIAAIPTALPVVASLTTPFRARHPEVRFTVRSTTSAEILSLLANLEADIGLTYLDNEPLGRVTALPLYRESYRLITAADAPLGRRESVTWAEAAGVPLCLLTPDMQNRRIVDAHLRAAGTEPATALESNSMIVLMTHVRTGRWASILPTVLAGLLGLTEPLRAIPITAPEVSHAIGLVALQRDPALSLVSAFVAEAREAALGLSGSEELPI